MELDNKRIGERLRELRTDHGFKQKEVAEYLGLSQSLYSMIEHGKRRLKWLSLVEKLALLYNCDEDYILCLHDEYNIYGSIAYQLYIKNKE